MVWFAVWWSTNLWAMFNKTMFPNKYLNNTCQSNKDTKHLLKCGFMLRKCSEFTVYTRREIEMIPSSKREQLGSFVCHRVEDCSRMGFFHIGILSNMFQAYPKRARLSRQLSAQRQRDFCSNTHWALATPNSWCINKNLHSPSPNVNFVNINSTSALLSIQFWTQLRIGGVCDGPHWKNYANIQPLTLGRRSFVMIRVIKDWSK